MAAASVRFRIFYVSGSGALTLRNVSVVGGRTSDLVGLGGGIFLRGAATRLTLEGHGYRVRTAADGVSGLALFRASRPDVAVLDIMHLKSPQSAILSAVIFNALIIIALIPLALRGVSYQALGAAAVLRRNVLIYGLGGIILPIDHLPGFLQPIAAFLPATALSELLRYALASGGPLLVSPAAPLGILAAWAVAAIALAVRTFRWY